MTDRRSGATRREHPGEDEQIRGAGQIRMIGERLIMVLPEEASAQLPSRGQVSVQAVLNGHAVDTVLEPDGMKGHWLSLDGKLRDRLAVLDGDTVEFCFAPTKDWPEPEIPEDLRTALEDAPDLAEPWADITPMARWEWVRWVNATKNPQTRERRVEVTISKLRDGKRRPCCFNLAGCTDPELTKNGKLIGLG